MQLFCARISSFVNNTTTTIWPKDLHALLCMFVYKHDDHLNIKFNCLRISNACIRVFCMHSNARACNCMHVHAQRAFNCMLEHAIECDVFIKTFLVILVSEWRTSGRLERIGFGSALQVLLLWPPTLTTVWTCYRWLFWIKKLTLSANSLHLWSS
jgi:hypothetical protein